MPKKTKGPLTLADCEAIQRDLPLFGVKAMQDRFRVSKTTIYNARDGKLPVQLRVKTQGKPKPLLPPPPATCPTCGYSIRLPCPICAAITNASDIAV